MAFHSRTFTSPELNYDTHDKELLAIFDAFRVWRHFLEGSASPIDVVTDQKILNILPLQKSSHVAKLAGPNTFVGSICLSASALVVLVLNLIPCLAVGTSTQKGEIMTMQK